MSIEQLRTKLNTGIDNGTLTRTEYEWLKGTLRLLREIRAWTRVRENRDRLWRECNERAVTGGLVEVGIDLHCCDSEAYMAFLLAHGKSATVKAFVAERVYPLVNYGDADYHSMFMWAVRDDCGGGGGYSASLSVFYHLPVDSVSD